MVVGAAADEAEAGGDERGREILGPNRGYRYGVGPAVEAVAGWPPRGSYGWDGGFGTTWYNLPAKDLTAVLLTQRVFDGPEPPPLIKDFWRAADAATACDSG